MRRKCLADVIQIKYLHVYTLVSWTCPNMRIKLNSLFIQLDNAQVNRGSRRMHGARAKWVPNNYFPNPSLICTLCNLSTTKMECKTTVNWPSLITWQFLVPIIGKHDGTTTGHRSFVSWGTSSTWKWSDSLAGTVMKNMAMGLNITVLAYKAISHIRQPHKLDLKPATCPPLTSVHLCVHI